ncbi:carboxypeptidase-like regulatory domain-containing protein [Riemerella columbina]|uniref:carboxypeptidase-like regulatory domain-containing protein n=1 Tax=Riemerella columbina TaxID=103810 RepID=UPI0003A3ACEC|nr:carboxypeptidase-like regulatory domain-containing protein [Riemerella columbina]
MKQIFLLLMLMLTQFILAQTNISGSVLFKNKGVQYASVSLINSYDGSTTDVSGRFTFETEEKGPQVILVQHPDYNDQYDTIEISHQPIELTILLKENFKAIDAVVISAGKMEASDKKRATVLLSALDMYTTAGSGGQVSQALTTLAGTQSVENASGLFVRGGTGNETQFYIDGNLVNHYFSNTVPGFSGRDRMNPSLFKDNVFSTGGYSAQYGQALSSVLALESVDFPNQSSVDLGIAPFFISGGFQQVNEPKTKSYGLMTTYTDFSLMKKLMSQTIEFKEVPKSWASNFNFRLKTKNGIVKYYGSYDQNNMSIIQPNVEFETLKNETALKSKNTFHSLFWKEQWGRYTLNMGSSFTYNSTYLNFKTLKNGQEFFNKALETKDYYLNTKTTLERKIGYISAIRAGIEWNYANERIQLPQLNLQYPSVQYRLATFVDSDWGISKTLALKLGLRSEYTSLTASWTYAPRAAVGYRVDRIMILMKG